MKTKHIVLYIAAAASALLAMASCSGYLDKMPMTEPNDKTYLSSESQIYSYINGLYIALPSLSQYGMGARSEEKNSDNILAERYDLRLNGENTAFSGDTDWSKGYENLRDVNYFFGRYLVNEADETDELRSLRGEAHFFRAYWHFWLLKKFGNIPVMDEYWDDRATVEGLQIPASPRNKVARFILDDLDKAAGLLYPRSVYGGLRINREAALTLAMNVALYEGSWEKYHANDKFAAAAPEPEWFFGQVMTLGDELFLLMPPETSLNTKENSPFECKRPVDAFAGLFNQKDYAKVPEALFWKKYSNAAGVYHSLTPNLASGVVDTEGPAGVSLSLVDSYLNADGTFIDPSDEKFKDFNNIFKGRDPRLAETVMSTGHLFKSETELRPMNVVERKPVTDDMSDEEKKAAEEFNAAILSPYLTGGGNGRNVTGFHIALGVDPDYTSADNQFYDTGLIFIRYAEALLAYAEAAEELGRCDDAVLGKTVKLLRERAGVTYVAPAADPNFTDFGYELTPNLQEIRRERRTELALQGFRQDDLMRWAGHRLITGQRGRGAYFGDESVLYKSFNTTDEDVKESLALLKKDKDGWLDPLAELLPNGYGFKPERDYLLPIPPDDVLMLGDKLPQNPGWNQ